MKTYFLGHILITSLKDLPPNRVLGMQLAHNRIRPVSGEHESKPVLQRGHADMHGLVSDCWLGFSTLLFLGVQKNLRRAQKACCLHPSPWLFPDGSRLPWHPIQARGTKPMFSPSGAQCGAHSLLAKPFTLSVFQTPASQLLSRMEPWSTTDPSSWTDSLICSAQIKLFKVWILVA